MIHAVYRDMNTVAKVVDDIKAKDHGFSVVVSGLLDAVDTVEKAMVSIATARVLVRYWGGRTELLPPPPIFIKSPVCAVTVLYLDISLNKLLKI